MKTSLICEYDISALPVITAFVKGGASAVGASQGEAGHIELAAEEVAVHVISSYLEQFDSESFVISCETKDSGLLFSFEDKGLPIDVDKSLSYDAAAPEGRLEALGFHIAKSVCDKFDFENRGKSGWLISFFKAIKDFRLPPPAPVGGARTENAPKERERLELRNATPGDIPALMELTYYTFRYTHEPEYYTKGGLEAMMASPHRVFTVVNTASGKLVASQEYYVDPAKTSDIAFYGTLMTHPDYRDGAAIVKIFKNLKANVETPPHPEAKLWVQELVTSHSASQRFADILEASVCALELSRDRIMDFSGDLKSVGQRESFLLSWRWLRACRGTHKVKMHCLPEHEAMLAKIFSWQGIHVEIDCSTLPAGPRADERVGLTLELSELDRFGLIAAKELPRAREDFSFQLRRLKDEAFGKGAVTVALHLPTERPLPAYLTESLREHGFFFCGVVPVSSSKHELKFTCLGAQDFDFGKLQLSAESSKELYAYAKAEYAKV